VSLAPFQHEAERSLEKVGLSYLLFHLFSGHGLIPTYRVRNVKTRPGARLQHSHEVFKNTQEWLPWNYEDAIAALPP
jgi:hypothetical protein